MIARRHPHVYVGILFVFENAGASFAAQVAAAIGASSQQGEMLALPDVARCVGREHFDCIGRIIRKV